MPPSHQETFIADVRSALGHSRGSARSRYERLLGQPISPASGQVLEAVRLRTRSDRHALLDILCEQAR